MMMRRGISRRKNSKEGREKVTDKHREDLR